MTDLTAYERAQVRLMAFDATNAICVRGDMLERMLLAETLTNWAIDGASPVKETAAAEEPQHPAPALTGRQSQVLPLLAEGLSNKEIAYRLDLSEGTIKLYVRALCVKYKVNNRTKLALIATRGGADMTVHLSLRRNTITVDGHLRSNSHQQVTLLWLLMCHREVSIEMIVEALWPDADDMPDAWSVALRTLQHRLRNSLYGSGWVIKTMGRSRWSLDSAPVIEIVRRAA